MNASFGKTTLALVSALTMSLVLLSGIVLADGVSGLKRVQLELVAPPFLPEHEQIAGPDPVVVEVRLVIQEMEVEISPGVFVQAMTFNGSIPGPLIVVHQDDYVELTLVNPTSSVFLHNIDFHASTGALGGAELSKVAPGQEVVLRFKATKPGVFVYHCAPGGLMVPYHVVSGMNGAIMVLPRGGLTDQDGKPVRYDRAYYIGEQDFYIPKDENGNFRRYKNAAAAMPDTLNVMKGLVPSHIVFNGAVGALTGDGALQASVGENVLFIHFQANRDSRPHLIGGHGDLVWDGGSFSDPPLTNRETWFIPGGTAVAMIYQFRQPGLYAYLNHNLIEAFMLGAAAHVQVAGEWDDNLMKQVKKPAASSN
ncbi:MAG: nitrite reductase, copper-containing [SAR324 cluster bacterium]|nr:nitrite reductase, copper-containing [SAR324 cluster bacterium]